MRYDLRIALSAALIAAMTGTAAAQQPDAGHTMHHPEASPAAEAAPAPVAPEGAGEALPQAAAPAKPSGCGCMARMGGGMMGGHGAAPAGDRPKSCGMMGGAAAAGPAGDRPKSCGMMGGHGGGAAAAPGAAATSGHGGGMGMMGGMMGRGGGAGAGPAMLPFEHVEGRLAFLKAELAITAEQETAWTAFAEAARTNAAALRDHHRSMTADATPPADFPARIDRHLAMMTTHLEALKRLEAAVDPLYAALSEDQKKQADALMTGPMGPPMGMHLGATGRGAHAGH